MSSETPHSLFESKDIDSSNTSVQGYSQEMEEDLTKNPSLLPIIIFRIKRDRIEEELLISTSKLETLEKERKELLEEYWVKDNPAIKIFNEIIQIQNEMLFKNTKLNEIVKSSFNNILDLIKTDNLKLDMSKYKIKELEKKSLEDIKQEFGSEQADKELKQRIFEIPKIKKDMPINEFEDKIRQGVKMNIDLKRKWKHYLIMTSANLKRWESNESMMKSKLLILKKIEKEFIKEGEAPIQYTK